MKNFILFYCIVFAFNTSKAQNELESSQDFESRNPIYDYNEKYLNSTDTIPDFSSKEYKLKIEGTVFLNDGVTPAENVLIFINQADENGDYDLRKHNNKRYVHHRAWVKTDKNGKYAFYTFIPSTDIRSRMIKEIHTVIKEPGMLEYDAAGFVFEDDRLLSRSCRKKIAKQDPKSILKLIKDNNILTAKRDFILKSGNKVKTMADINIEDSITLQAKK